jgi:hypothetical protein
MNANRSIALSLGFAIWAGLLSFPASLFAAQPAKTPPAKEQPNKTPPADDKNVTWKLAGREGDCTPLDILGKKGPAYSDIKSPRDLVEKLKANGHPAEMKEFKAGIRPAVEVRSPSAGIHVMFVRQDYCDKKLPAVEKK